MQIGLSFRFIKQSVKELDLPSKRLWFARLIRSSSSLSQVGWISNPLIVEGLLAVEVILFVYFTKSIFVKTITKKA